jgi:site-specific recombinase XerD
MTIIQAIKQFAMHRTAVGNSPKTIDSYQRELHRLQRFLPQDYPVERILANQLDNFLNSDLSQMRFGGGKRKPGSIANTKAALNSFFKWLQGARHIEHNPAITTHIVKQRNLPTYLSPEEEKSLLKTIKEIRGWQAERDFTAISILLNTGVRLSELTGIDVADVDLDENRLSLKRTKGGQPAIKHINTKLKKILQRYLNQRLQVETECPALFLSQWHRRLSDRQFALRLEMWAKKAGIAKKVTPHVLRHTFASNLYAKTKNLLAVQKALGHEYITTTQIYTHIQDEELHSALETL